MATPTDPAPTLAQLTTLRVGGPARAYVEVHEEGEFLDALRRAEADGPLLVLGGGSNLVVADAGFDGTVVRDVRSRIEAHPRGQEVDLVVAAGTVWDDVVARTVAEGWGGLEALSGIPGSTGATPVQNVGAYGREVGQVLGAVRAWDRAEARVVTLGAQELDLGYRTSVLRRTLAQAPFAPTPRHVVLEVHLRLTPGACAPVGYRELADRLGVGVGERAPLDRVRSAVLELRRGKGMVLDPADHDTWSAGSFFTNPVLDAASVDLLPAGAPRFPMPDGRVKTSAAWLIAHAGIERGWGIGGPVTISTRHTLALTNRGGASTADVLALAGAVRERVRAVHGITLTPEPVLVGASL